MLRGSVCCTLDTIGRGPCDISHFSYFSLSADWTDERCSVAQQAHVLDMNRSGDGFKTNGSLPRIHAVPKAQLACSQDLRKFFFRRVVERSLRSDCLYLRNSNEGSTRGGCTRTPKNRAGGFLVSLVAGMHLRLVVWFTQATRCATDCLLYSFPQPPPPLLSTHQ